MIPAALLWAWSLAASWTAAAAPSSKPLPGEEIELKSVDGWTLKAAYLAAEPEQKTFVLLHGTGQRKEHWLPMAQALKRRGMGYLALDFRGHGGSLKGPDGQELSWRKFKSARTENEFENMARDVDAAFSYLAAQKAPEDSVGVIGSDVGSSIGLKYAAVRPKIPLVVMLSPGLSYQEVLTVNAMRAYQRRPILMVYGLDDRYSARATPLLYGFARLSAGEDNATVLTVPREHGLAMFKRQKGLSSQIIDWLDHPVKMPEVSSSTAPSSPAEPVPSEN